MTSVADKMYQGKRRNRSNSEMAIPSASDSIETDIHRRLFFVLDQVIGMIPTEGQEHPMAKMLSAFVREGKKDLKRMPSDMIQHFARQLGEAFSWVADGTFDSPEEISNEPVGDNAEEG